MNSVLLECDSSVLKSITHHLKVYKIRRKVLVEACPDLSLWSLLGLNTHCTQPAEGQETEPEPEVRNGAGVVAMVRDPRTPLMGWRLITKNQENPQEIIKACSHGDVDEYHRHRYRIGTLAHNINNYVRKCDQCSTCDVCVGVYLARVCLWC